MNKSYNKILILLMVISTIYTLISIPKLVIAIKEGIKEGFYGVFFVGSFILFCVVLLYSLGRIRFKKSWKLDSLIGEIRVHNYWKLNLNSGEHLYFEGNLVDKKEENIWDLIEYSSQVLRYTHINSFGKEYLVEAFIKPGKYGITHGCEIFINRELVFSK